MDKDVYQEMFFTNKYNGEVKSVNEFNEAILMPKN